MQLGIGSYALTWSVGVPGYTSPQKPVTALDLLQKAAECGIGLVQIADNMPLHVMRPSQLEQIRQKADELGIVLEVGTRGTSPELLLQYLSIAKFFRAGIVRTLITHPHISEAERDIREVLSRYEEAGITIAIENHGLHRVADLVSLFEALDSRHIGSCLDTVNSFGALEGPESVMEALSPYTVNLHIKDFDIRRVSHQMGFEILGTPAGSGRLDIDRLIRRIEKYGNRPSAILELWTPYTGSVEETVRLEAQWFHQSLAYLKEKFPASST